MTVEIKMKKGFVVVIDDEDADLAELKWYACGSTGEYARRKFGQMSMYIHQIILERLLQRELAKDELCDHENGNYTDCRRSNLRLASRLQNSQNQKLRSDNTSGYKGVVWSKGRGKWQAHIKINRKQKHLGTFNDPIEAHRAYAIAALTYHAPFHNFGHTSPFLGWTLEQLQAPVIQLALPLTEAA